MISIIPDMSRDNGSSTLTSMEALRVKKITLGFALEKVEWQQQEKKAQEGLHLHGSVNKPEWAECSPLANVGLQNPSSPTSITSAELSQEL